MRDLYLGIDLGTSGVKVAVVDAAGRIPATAQRAYTTHVPRPGWAEHDPEAWWSACRDAVRDLGAAADLSRVAALSVVGLSPACICLDARGGLVRPAPIWSDQRALTESAELVETLGPHAAFSPLPYLLWLERHEPERYAQTHRMLGAFEYMAFRLTGRAVCIPHVGEAPPWAPEVLERAGVDPRKLPDSVCPTGTVVGPVRGETARSLGLRDGVPVVAGTLDAFAAWLGTGAVRPGAGCNTVGTTDGFIVVTREPVADPKLRVHAIPHVTGSHFVVGGPMSSGGVLVDWIARRFFEGERAPFAAIEVAAASVQPGADGLVVLPYLVGERSPIFDPDARCVFFGVGEAHTRAHFARAALEGVAFAVRDVCDVLLEIGAPIDDVRIAGAAARNAEWNRIKADVLGRPVLVPETTQSSALGAAIVAAVGVGAFPNPASAAEAMVTILEVVEPDAERTAFYEDMFALYRELYEHVRKDFARLGQLRRARPGGLAASPRPSG